LERKGKVLKKNPWGKISLKGFSPFKEKQKPP